MRFPLGSPVTSPGVSLTVSVNSTILARGFSHSYIVFKGQVKDFGKKTGMHATKKPSRRPSGIRSHVPGFFSHFRGFCSHIPGFFSHIHS